MTFSTLGDVMRKSFLGDVWQEMQRTGEREEAFELALRAKASGDAATYWSNIRKIHKLNEPAVARGEYEPYIVDWLQIFTPIEEDAWFSIRTYGLRMFPQYPIGNVFVDFANPWSRWIIECDGRDYHDPEKDRRRDQRLFELGWHVLRFSGSELWKSEDEPESAHNAIRELRDVLNKEWKGGTL